MSQEAVLKILGDKHRLVPTGQEDWAILDKNPALPGVGSIAFKNRRLSYVNRIWIQAPPADGTAVAETSSESSRVSQGTAAQAARLGHIKDSLQEPKVRRPTWFAAGRRFK